MRALCIRDPVLDICRSLDAITHGPEEMGRRVNRVGRPLLARVGWGRGKRSRGR